jgi:adenylate cyclase
VRDTPEERTMQECLTTFCSKARSQILNDGGMLCQFLGDAVIGFFGIPDYPARYVEGWSRLPWWSDAAS